MKEQLAKKIAWLVAGLAFSLMIGQNWISWTSKAHDRIISWIGDSVYLLYTLSALSVGLLIIQRVKGNPYGWVWLFNGFFVQFLSFWQAYATYSLVTAPGSLPFGWGAAALTALGWVSWLATFVFSLLLFPNGRLPSPRWRFVGWLTLAGVLLAIPITPIAPGQSGFVPLENPVGAGGFFGQVVSILLLASVFLIFFSMLAGILSLFVRFRRSTGHMRQQLKWFAFAAFVFGIYIMSDFFVELPGIWENVKEGLVFAFMPISIGMAVLRHRLWDIDIIIRRTLVYSVVSLFLAAVYFSGVTLLQLVFTAVSGQRSAAAIVLSTLAIAALFNPLRKRVQDFVDRRFYRRKYDAEQALASFAALARQEVDLEQISDRLLGVVEETVQPEQVSLWLKPAIDRKQRLNSVQDTAER